jgi:serine/threonine protein kinase
VGGGKNDVGVGDSLGDYRILAPLGEGGMGVVYLARDTQLERQVALKLIAPHLARDQEFRKRFIAEARAAAAIDHPNVVTIYSAGTVDDNLYIAMRFVKGRDLGVLLREQGPVATESTIQLAAEVAGALDAAHDLGLVHRDVKPANVLLEGAPGHGKGYLTDFGLIKHARSQTKLTGTAQWLGTIDYVAPEQIQGAEVGPYTDVYALGCVLYEILTGEVPFAGDDLQKMWGHVHDPLPDTPLRRLDSPLAAAIRRATAKDPRDRFGSAGDFARALTGAAPTVTGRAPLHPREARTKTMSSPSPQAAKAPRTGRSHRRALVALAATVVAAGLLAGVIALSGGGSPSRTTTVVKRTPAAPASADTSRSTDSSSSDSPAGVGDWPGGSAYSALVGAFSSEASARTWQSRAIDRGLEAGVIYSSEFRSLRPGYWVVFSGAFGSLSEAEARAARTESLGFPGSYAKLVAP